MVYTCGSCPLWLICRRPQEYGQSQSASLPVFFFFVDQTTSSSQSIPWCSLLSSFLLVKKQLLEATGWWWSSGHPFQINGGINNSSESIFNYEILLSIYYNIICELYVIIKGAKERGTSWMWSISRSVAVGGEDHYCFPFSVILSFYTIHVDVEKKIGKHKRREKKEKKKKRPCKTTYIQSRHHRDISKKKVKSYFKENLEERALHQESLSQ